MNVSRILCCCALVTFLGRPVSVPADDGTTPLPDCAGLQLNLEGADHYYWITPSRGRVLLDRQCVPAEADCDHDVLVVWDADGRKLFEAAPVLDIPEMSGGMTLDAALRTPDRLVVSASVGAAYVRSVLAEYDVRSRALLRVASTGSIRCHDLHADDDGVIWCLGVDVDERRAGGDFDLVYRFDESGTALGSTLPRSTYPQSVPLFRSANPRAGRGGGFLSGDGDIRLWLPAVGELVSFDDAGHVSDRMELPAVEGTQRARLITAPGNEIFAMFIVGPDEAVDAWSQALYRLAPDGSAWWRLAESREPLPMEFALVGADDAGLILLDRRTLTLCPLPIAATD